MKVSTKKHLGESLAFGSVLVIMSIGVFAVMIVNSSF
jgi:hypothetical protein